MLKILGCFKIVRDFEGITPSELCDLRDGTLNLSVFRKIIGNYDEAALETARRLADAIRSSDSCTLHAITVGSCDARFAKELYAVGFDEVFCICPFSETAGSKSACTYTSEEVAGYLTQFIQSTGGYHAILTGQQAWPDESGLMPYILAHRLDVPCLSQVTDLTWNNGFHVSIKNDRGILTCSINTPAVYMAGNTEHPYLKLATLQEKLKTGSRRLSVIQLSPASSVLDLGQSAKLLYEEPKHHCRFIEGADTAEKAKILWEEVLDPCRTLRKQSTEE